MAMDGGLASLPAKGGWYGGPTAGVPPTRGNPAGNGWLINETSEEVLARDIQPNSFLPLPGWKNR